MTFRDSDMFQEPSFGIAEVRFPGYSPKTYDYFAPFPVKKGDQVVVLTARGEATVEVISVKHDLRKAEKSLLRMGIEGKDY